MTSRFVRSSLLALTAVLAARSALADVATADDAYAKLLIKYVTPAGVRYEAWRSTGGDLKRLSEVLMAYRTADIAPMKPVEREALLINLYNAQVVELVLQARPQESIRDLSRGLNPNEIFKRKILVLAGKASSLNDIEDRLRSEFKDPRTHFAIDRASRSGPRLRPEPYLASSLDDQLDDATRSFLAGPGEARVVRTGGRTILTVSKIFDWYAKDFAPAGGVDAFLAKYGPKDVADAVADGRAKIDYADYDWSLNGVR